MLLSRLIVLKPILTLSLSLFLTTGVQVIQTLTSIVKCEHKTAIEYVTSIDREGRAVVKCASFEVCKKLKEDIENKAMRSTLTTRAMPLKVTVMHRNEVACQHLAMQLLVWCVRFA